MNNNQNHHTLSQSKFQLLSTLLVIACLWLAATSLFLPVAQAQTTNLALNKPVTCSSIENAGTPCTNAVDGNTGTRWSSAHGVDPQWIRVDLGATTTISRVVLRWEAAYGKSYQIQTSNDATNWTNIYTTTTGNGGIDDLTGLSGSGRYVRMHGTVRATQYGYSLWEFEVYGASPITPTPTSTFCPLPTQEPLRVEPVTSPTTQLSQVVTVYIGRGEAVTVTTESGVFAVTGTFNAFTTPALVNVSLLPNTTHHLSVQARVSQLGCYPSYTLSTTVDRNGAPLVIVQQSGPVTPTPTNTSVTPTPTNTGVTPTPTNTTPPPSNTATSTPVPVVNLARNKPVVCSSVENAGTACANAVDGNTGTRWGSAFSDPQWIRVDLGTTQSLNRIVLRWETAYGKSYQLQTSNDGTTWTTIYSTTTGNGGIDDLTGLSGSGRYVRMNGTVRATQYGYSLWEFEVY